MAPFRFEKYYIYLWFKPAVSILLALAVFALCYWIYPHRLASNGQMSMFVWDYDYISQQISQPHGITSTLWAFIAQFFYNTLLGSIVMSALCVSLQWILWTLLKKLTPPRKGLRSICYILSFIPAIMINLHVYTTSNGSEEEQVYDYSLRKGKWEKILAMGESRQPQSPCCAAAVSLSQKNLGQSTHEQVLALLLPSPPPSRARPQHL